MEYIQLYNIPSLMTSFDLTGLSMFGDTFKQRAKPFLLRHFKLRNEQLQF